MSTPKYGQQYAYLCAHALVHTHPSQMCTYAHLHVGTHLHHTHPCARTQTHRHSCLPPGCPWHLTVLRCPLARYSPPSLAWAVPGGSAVISFSIFFSPRRPLQHERPKGMSGAQSCMRFIREAPVVVVSDCVNSRVSDFIKKTCVMNTHTHLHTQVLNGIREHTHTREIKCSHRCEHSIHISTHTHTRTAQTQTSIGMYTHT